MAERTLGHSGGRETSKGADAPNQMKNIKVALNPDCDHMDGRKWMMSRARKEDLS